MAPTMEHLIKLRRELDEKRSQMKEILSSAETESRSLNQAEKTQFDELRAQADDLKETITRVETLEAEEMRSLSDGSGNQDKAAPTSEELRSLLADGVVTERAMTTVNTGEVMIPEVTRNIMRLLKEDSPIRRLANHHTTSVHQFEIPVQMSKATVERVSDETTTRNGTDTPTLDMAQITLGEVSALPKVSNRLLDLNSGFDIEGFVNGSVADAFSEDENARFADVLNNATESADAFDTIGTINTQSLTTLTNIDELRDFTKKLPRKYRKHGSWLMTESQLTELEKLKDADNKPLIGSIEGSGVSTLFGFAIEVDDNLTADTFYFGDFSRGMAVVDHTMGVYHQVDKITEKGQTKFHSYIYSGAGLVDPHAMLKGKLSA
ncbi:phage major capsid protein [Vibrio mytili]